MSKESTLITFSKLCGGITAVGIFLTLLALTVENYMMAAIIFSLPALFDLSLFGVTVLSDFEEEDE